MLSGTLPLLSSLPNLPLLSLSLFSSASTSSSSSFFSSSSPSSICCCSSAIPCPSLSNWSFMELLLLPFFAAAAAGFFIPFSLSFPLSFSSLSPLPLFFFSFFFFGDFFGDFEGVGLPDFGFAFALLFAFALAFAKAALAGLFRPPAGGFFGAFTTVGGGSSVSSSSGCVASAASESSFVSFVSSSPFVSFTSFSFFGAMAWRYLTLGEPGRYRAVVFRGVTSPSLIKSKKRHEHFICRHDVLLMK